MPITVGAALLPPRNSGSSMGGFSGISPSSRMTSTELIGDLRRLLAKAERGEKQEHQGEKHEHDAGHQTDEELRHNYSDGSMGGWWRGPVPHAVETTEVSHGG